MDLDGLHTFISVTETGSFSRAAELHFLTQPAISKRIAALEMELSVQLFDRIGKKVILTEAGKLLYGRARRIINECDDCKRALSSLDEQVRGTLSFATSHHIGLHRLPDPLRKFSNSYPELELDLRFLDSEEALKSVIRGDIELAIITLPEETVDELNMATVWVDQLIPVIADFHPLSKFSSTDGREMQFKDLAIGSAILPGEKTFTHSIIIREFLQHGINVKMRLSSNYLEMIKMMIGAGLGWGFLPLTMVEEDGFSVISLPNLHIERRLGVATHKLRTLSRGAQALIEQLLEAGIEK